MSAHVSVVIPTYNHGHLIGDALSSLQSQHFTDWEALVVNNFSTDNTDAVVQGFNDARIRLIHFNNQGVIAASRNHGAAQARAPILAFLDSDDIWYPDKLTVSLNKLASGFDLVCHAENWVGNTGLNRAVRYGPSRRAAYDSLLFKGNCLSTSAVVMSAALFTQAGGFSEDPALVTAEDYDLWMEAARLGARIGFVDEILGEYRLHGGNQSGAAERHHRAVVSVLHKHFERRGLGSLGDKLRARRRLALAAYGCGRMLQDNTQFADATAWLCKAVATWPFAAKPWAALALNTVRYRI